MHASNLNLAPVGQWCRIAAGGIRNTRLLELGFLPHEQVRVLRRSWFRQGALVVQVGPAVFGLRPAEASQIRLEAA